MKHEITTFKELIEQSKKTGKKVFELSQENEAYNSEVQESFIREQTSKILAIMEDAIRKGIASNELSSSKMSGKDCEKLINYYKNSDKILLNKTQQKILTYAIATAEENARMGKIAACPTAGACGIVPAIILGYSHVNKINKEKQIDALISAGEIGKIISRKVAMAGAVMGCQGECGVAAAMASGALVELCNGTTEQISNAVALTIKNIMGLVCDPIAGLVEVPCIKRNGFMAMTALTGAELALSGIESVIPTDEVIDAMYQVGNLMSPLLKETSEAGLATTKTGLKLTEEIFDLQNN